MARVTLISSPQDYPGSPDAATSEGLAELFGTLFPGQDAPAFDAAHDGMAIAAHAPKLALALARVSGLIAGELGWCKRTDLRELAIQRRSRHFGSDYSWQSRMGHGQAAGLTPEQLADVAEWRASAHFDGDQRLTLEYTEAVVAGAVDDALFDRVKARWGEAGAVECTTLIGFWSFWAMLLGATRPG
jgi:alkylhydroperoxidase family enzyme